MVDLEQPVGVIVQSGGQTAINLAEGLVKNGVNILGTTVEDLDAAEDREVFDKVITDLNLKQPIGLTATTHSAVIKAAEKIGYPVLVHVQVMFSVARPWRLFIIKKNWNNTFNKTPPLLLITPILIDAYLEGRECRSRRNL